MCKFEDLVNFCELRDIITVTAMCNSIRLYIALLFMHQTEIAIEVVLGNASNPVFIGTAKHLIVQTQDLYKFYITLCFFLLILVVY